MVSTKQKIWSIIKTVIVGIIAIGFVVPLIWMILSSLKTTPEVFARPYHWLPQRGWQWGNYAEVWNNKVMPMARAMFNSIYITVFSIIGALIISSFAAYAFAKVDFKGKGIVFALFLSTMMIPGQVTIIPRYMLFRTIGLYNNLWALIIPSWFTTTAIFLLRQFYKGLPDDLADAAKIDGAGHFRIFLQIMMPLTKTVMLTLSLLIFISSWNEYLSALIFLPNNAKATLAQSVRWWMQDDSHQYNLIMAASSISLIPIMALFVFLQKYFVEGIASSGVKG